MVNTSPEVGTLSPPLYAAALLASIAEFERELIRERTGEGRKRAMAAGVKFGRKRKLSDYQRAEAIKRRGAGETLASKPGACPSKNQLLLPIFAHIHRVADPIFLKFFRQKFLRGRFLFFPKFYDWSVGARGRQKRGHNRSRLASRSDERLAPMLLRLPTSPAPR
jgi:hypothetical protein